LWWGFAGKTTSLGKGEESFKIVWERGSIGEGEGNEGQSAGSRKFRYDGIGNGSTELRRKILKSETCSVDLREAVTATSGQSATRWDAEKVERGGRGKTSLYSRKTKRGAEEGWGVLRPAELKSHK